jgi:hypothetical protein
VVAIAVEAWCSAGKIVELEVLGVVVRAMVKATTPCAAALVS